jgi:glucose/arabinose dehydrogenase
MLALGLAVASCSYLGLKDDQAMAQTQAPTESAASPQPQATEPAPAPAETPATTETKATPPAQVTVTPELEAAIAEAMKPRLKRPETALYRTVVAFDTQDGKILACGMVNAKTAYGDYVGYTLFRANLAVLKGADGKVTYQPVASALARDAGSFFDENPLCKPVG